MFLLFFMCVSEKSTSKETEICSKWPIVAYRLKELMGLGCGNENLYGFYLFSFFSFNIVCIGYMLLVCVLLHYLHLKFRSILLFHSLDRSGWMVEWDVTFH